MLTLENIVIVKLGGSVITKKDSTPPQVNEEHLHRIARELSTYDGKLIVVLGGGAHGHQAAHKYGFDNSKTHPNELMQGIPEIRHNMLLLSMRVEEILNAEGIPSVVFSPFMSVTLKDNIIDDFPLDIIRFILNSGLVPIIHGDVCIDKSKSASILSGDTIATYLAVSLSARTVLIGTNVDGVLESDPKLNPNAKHIPIINKFNQGLILEKTGPSSTTDVTGGMVKKIKELLTLSNQNVEVVIFNLLVSGRLADLLKGNPTTCTRFEYN
ncbi:isopentenyl phosphate kinase family protein [Candidatus Thorarchaeota archaeon]|nr:MAG: isopentenyl phosphate kinase family protein [Candidatus Thorarchaeota archaeon]